jgi:hypothetical protein
MKMMMKMIDYGQLIAVFLSTHFFWNGWGADQTIQQMRELCAFKDIEVLGFSNVRWLGFRRNKRIQQAVR